MAHDLTDTQRVLKLIERTRLLIAIYDDMPTKIKLNTQPLLKMLEAEINAESVEQISTSIEILDSAEADDSVALVKSLADKVLSFLALGLFPLEINPLASNRICLSANQGDCTEGRSSLVSGPLPARMNLPVSIPAGTDRANEHNKNIKSFI